MKWSGSLVVLAAILLLFIVLEADARGRSRSRFWGPIQPPFRGTGRRRGPTGRGTTGTRGTGRTRGYVPGGGGFGEAPTSAPSVSYYCAFLALYRVVNYSDCIGQLSIVS